MDQVGVGWVCTIVNAAVVHWMKCAFDKCTSWVGSVYVNCKNVICTTCVERCNSNYM